MDLSSFKNLSYGGQKEVYEQLKKKQSEFTSKILVRCREDVKINWRLFNKLFKEMGSEQIFGLASKIEHRAQYNMERMSNYGFWFNLPEAEKLFIEVSGEEKRVKAGLQQDFPPIAIPRNTKKPVTEVKFKVVKTKILDIDTGEPLKNGSRYVWEKEILPTWRDQIPVHTDHVIGDFCGIVWQPFNPNSPDQVKDKLETCGWQPVNFNKPSKTMVDLGIKIGSPKVSDEENLETIPDTAPQSIKNIGHYLIVSRRVSRLNEWFFSLGKDQRVHGRIMGVGAKTHRCSHQGPNMANVPAIYNRKGEKAYMGAEFRALWGVPKTQEEIDKFYFEGKYKTRDKRVQIGVDAEGIQLRILAHYMGDPTYTEQVINGDLHSYNMFAAGINPGTAKLDEDLLVKTYGCKPTLEELILDRADKKKGVEWSGRGVAKTFMYAFLLGAGQRKIFTITGIPGDILKERFYTEIPALRELQEVEIPGNVRKGYFIGIDGRKFSLDNVPPHKVLSIYLQAGEATVMKLALNMLISEIDKYDYDAFPVAFVHDEFQIDSAEHCSVAVQKLAEECIVKAGSFLKLKCPMAAKGSIGQNWRDCH